MTVYFHGSFGLNRDRMAKLIRLGLKNPKFKDKDMAKPFNYCAPFGAKYRSWLHKTGLTEMRLPIQLTPMGKVVIGNDPKLESDTSLWFLHHELTQDPERAEPWHYFANKFLTKNATFTKDKLLMGIMMQLRSHSEQHFGPGSKLNIVITKKILEAYTTDGALGRLGLVIEEKPGHYRRGKGIKRRGPWKTAEALAKSY
jgi:Protein of unknown function (DUF4007)